MLKFCKNFHRVFSAAFCRVVVNCELVELNFIGCHVRGPRFTKFLYSACNNFKCAPLKADLRSSNDSLSLDFMGKHKKTSHHSKHKDVVKSLDKKEKVHKESKKKKKKKKGSHCRYLKVDRKGRKLSIYRHDKSKKSATSIEEIFLDSSDSDNDIAIVFDSRVDRNTNNTKRKVSTSENIRIGTRNEGQITENREISLATTNESYSKITVAQGKKLITGRSQEEIKDIPLPDEISVVNAEKPELEVLEVSSIPLPDNCVATETIDSAKLQAAKGPVKLTDIEKTLQTSGANRRADSGYHPKRKKLRASGKQKSHNILKRSWQYTTMGAAMSSEEPLNTSQRHLDFVVLSYNVLSQSIMEDLPELYAEHDPLALNWDYRSQLLMEELRNFNADILCLQEVQQSHLEPFYSQLNDLGYSGIYKQRTGNKGDGVAIYYKDSVFEMVDHTTVEFYQPGVEILNRDNVGLVAKLAPKIKPEQRIVVATTHLLFNPRRHDVKLAQTQLLLAEIERFAFKEFDSSTGVAQYWPVILTGDLNLEPHTGVYQLLTTGSFRYEGLSQKTLSCNYDGFGGRNLSRHLLPSDLMITDTCQHWSLLMQRKMKILDHATERSLLKIYNSDYESNNNPSCGTYTEEDLTISLQATGKTKDNAADTVCSKDMSRNDRKNWFSSGKLSHNLNLKSVYVHDPEKLYDTSQATTNQGSWVVVDYIFYSSLWEQYLQQKAKDNLKLMARYKLYSKEEAEVLGPIPNLRSPSDHYPLCAKFSLLLI